MTTTMLRENARDTIMKAVNGDPVKDVVVFTGNGSTAAINDFVKMIEIDKVSTHHGRSNKPLVLISGYEHHSNMLPWRESGVDVCEIRESATTGAVDVSHLESVLRANRHRKRIIGSFSAGSNVTGICSDVKAIAIMLHRYGALACFDYACVAPYLGIEMNWIPSEQCEEPFSYLDAAFVSVHKFVGGVGATGLLLAKKAILTRRVPVSPGGGTVLFVTADRQEYLADIVPREEAGTPNIIGSIRAGLAFQIKNFYGIDNIIAREEWIDHKLRESVANHPNLVVLGPPCNLPDAHRIPIVSFLVKCGDKFLHHNFVSAVMNDVYGIQTRSGCMCAGPYAARLFGSTVAEVNDVADELYEKSYMKPGFGRLSLVYFNSDEEIDFIISALLQVADHAWKLLPQYLFDPKTSSWNHRHHRVSLPTFLDFSLRKNSMSSNDPKADVTEDSSNKYFQRILSEAMLMYGACHSLYNKDPYYRSDIIDYKSTLYIGRDAKYLWCVFPMDIASSACLELESDWNCRYDNCAYESNLFMRPQTYWESVLKAVAEEHIADASCLPSMFTTLFIISPRNRKFDV